MRLQSPLLVGLVCCISFTANVESSPFSALMPLANASARGSPTHIEVATIRLQNIAFLFALKGAFLLLIYKLSPTGLGEEFTKRNGEQAGSATFSRLEWEFMRHVLFSGRDSCLQKVACEETTDADNFVAAGRLILNAEKFFSVPQYLVSSSEQLINIIESASAAGRKASSPNSCERMYHCELNN